MLILRPVGFPSCQSRAAFSSLLFLGAGRNLSSLQHKICTLQPVVYFAGAGGCGGEAFLSCYMKQDLDTCRRSRCPRRGLQMAHASLGHPVPFYKPENLQLSLSAPLLYLHWLLGLDFMGCQKRIPKTSLTEDTARTACCFFPLLSPLPFAAGTK